MMYTSSSPEREWSLAWNQAVYIYTDFHCLKTSIKGQNLDFGAFPRGPLARGWFSCHSCRRASARHVAGPLGVMDKGEGSLIG